MKTEKWLETFANMLEKEETRHLTVQKAVIKMQFKNEISQEIELHEWEYMSKDALNLQIAQEARR